MNIDTLNRLYYEQNQPRPQQGMPRVMELAVQKFLEPIIDEIFQEREVETSLKLLNMITNLAHTVYLMGKTDGCHELNHKAEAPPFGASHGAKHEGGFGLYLE